MPSLEEMAQAVREQRSQLLQDSIVSSIPKALLLGTAAGVGTRGLMQLANLVRRNVSPPPRTLYSPYSPVMSDVPYPEQEPKRKKAAESNAPPPPPKPSLPPRPPKPTHPHKTAGIVDTLSDQAGRIFNGEYADSLASHPLGPVAIAGGLGLGAVGGYKLMDYLMQRRNKSMRAAELAQARKDFEQALLEQQTHKAASERTPGEKLGHELDRLADNYEKVAAVMEKEGFGQSAISKALGMYLLTGGLVAGLTGNEVYKYIRKRQPAAVLAKAEKQHRREMASMRPAPIFARPVPVAAGGGVAPNATELSGDVLDEDPYEE